ncbi:PilW family protein [Undibacterium parvum]|uniref:PilW family protein n=1 Tax=Undibacterium parvum TaxID=401471 RepID=UPI001D131459|nr:PilW family protein [Undibacterium parvum]
MIMPTTHSSNQTSLLTPKKQSGLTLIELMISITLGLLVVLAATAMVVSTKGLFISQTDGNETQDSARFALDNISRSLHQVGYVNYDFTNSPQITPDIASADLAGLDANSISATSADISTPLNSSVNFSDVLAVRFYGSGNTGNGDGTMSNCAGFSVPAPVSASTADTDRGWSIYYVANDANNEPGLYCKYYSSTSGKWAADAIVSGVESFQVLYGLDTSSPTDGLANKYLTAADINSLDSGLTLVGTTAAEKAKDLNRKTFWKKILLVKVAILVRGKENARTDATTSTYNLFGSAYATANSSNDKGTTISEVNLAADTRNRIRKVYSVTIQLRNNCMVDPVHGICLPPN